MTATTDHPLARNVAETLRELSDLLAERWGTEYAGAKRFGIPEAVAAVTKQDTLTRIVTERALVEAGIDVWWNDLLCTSPVRAASAVMAVAHRGVDLAELYGRQWEPIIGILKAAVLMDSQQLGAAGHRLLGVAYSQLYALGYEAARAFDCERLMERVLSDVLFACHKDGVTTPAAHERLMHGARVLELAAAWYVLDGVLASPDAALLEPIKRAFWPHLPNLNGDIA